MLFGQKILNCLLSTSRLTITEKEILSILKTKKQECLRKHRGLPLHIAELRERNDNKSAVRYNQRIPA